MSIMKVLQLFSSSGGPNGEKVSFGLYGKDL